MSTTARTPSTRPECQQFPGNCTLGMALKKIVDVYHRYSIREGHLDYLNFKEFNILLKEQAPTFLQACGRSRPNYLTKLFEETDVNNDKELTFEEFVIILAKLTDDAHHIIHNEERCKPDKD